MLATLIWDGIYRMVRQFHIQTTLSEFQWILKCSTFYISHYNAFSPICLSLVQFLGLSAPAVCRLWSAKKKLQRLMIVFVVWFRFFPLTSREILHPRAVARNYRHLQQVLPLTWAILTLVLIHQIHFARFKSIQMESAQCAKEER